MEKAKLGRKVRMICVAPLPLFSLSRAHTHTRTHTHARHIHGQTRIFNLTLMCLRHMLTHTYSHFSPTLTALRDCTSRSRCRRCGGGMALVRRRRTDWLGPTLGCSLGRRRLRRSPSLHISESILQSETTPAGCHCAYSQAGGGWGSCGLNHSWWSVVLLCGVSG